MLYLGRHDDMSLMFELCYGTFARVSLKNALAVFRLDKGERRTRLSHENHLSDRQCIHAWPYITARRECSEFKEEHRTEICPPQMEECRCLTGLILYVRTDI